MIIWRGRKDKAGKGICQMLLRTSFCGGYMILNKQDLQDATISSRRDKEVNKHHLNFPKWETRQLPPKLINKLKR